MTGTHDRRALRRLLSLRLLGSAVLAAGLAACGNAAADSAEFARITVEGDAHPLLLEISRDFEVVLDPGSGRTSAAIISSDTLDITPPFSQTFELTSRFRILTRLKNLGPDTVDARMRVEIDGELKYDQSATLGIGGFLQSVFVLQTYR